MKKFFTLLALCAMTLSASAQFVNSRSGSTSSRSTSDNENYNRITLSYNSLSSNATGAVSMDGVKLGWLHGWNIGSIPLYIEGGVNLQCNFDSESGETYYDYYDDEYYSYGDKETLLLLNLPVNVAYRLNFPNSSISFSPYAGFHISTGILYKSGSYDYYSDGEYNRVTGGLQIGAGFTFNKFYLGFEYSTDVTNLIGDIKMHNVSATVGLQF